MSREARKEFFKECHECLKIGKTTVISSSNFRKHLSRIHSLPFLSQKSNKKTECEGCQKQICSKSLQKHQRICQQFLKIYGPSPKKRIKKTILTNSFGLASRTFSLKPVQPFCHYKDQITYEFNLDYIGNRINGTDLPKFNKDRNPKTISFASKLKGVEAQSSFQEKQEDSIPKKRCLFKSKDSFCQICGKLLKRSEILSHIHEKQHCFRISTGQINLAINELVCKYRIKTSQSSVTNTFINQNPQKIEKLMAKCFKNIMSPGFIVFSGNNQIISREQGVIFPIASITKLINLMVCLELIDELAISQKQLVQIPEFTLKKAESSAFLAPGQKLSIKDLIYGMLLPSGNQAAIALAKIFGQRMKKKQICQNIEPLDLYLVKMIKFCKKLGMQNTKLYNVKGYSSNILEKNESTPYDLILLMKEVAKNKTAVKFLSTEAYSAKITDKYGKIKTISWTTVNKLLSKGFIGKTGHAFGYPNTFTFLGFKKVKGIEVYICVLGCKSESGRFTDILELFNFVNKRNKLIISNQLTNPKSKIVLVPNSPEGKMVNFLQNSIAHNILNYERFDILLESVKFHDKVMYCLKVCEVCHSFCHQNFLQCNCGARIHRKCQEKEQFVCSCLQQLQDQTQIVQIYPGKIIHRQLLNCTELRLEVMIEKNLDLEEKFQNILLKRGVIYNRSCIYHPSLSKQLNFLADPFLEVSSSEIEHLYQLYLDFEWFPPVQPKQIWKKGLGVVATKKIPKNTLLFEYGGDVIPANFGRLNPNYSMAILEGTTINESAIITVIKYSSCGPLLNHSKQGNCKTIRLFSKISNFPIVLLYTFKQIEVGQELTYNYNSGNLTTSYYPTNDFL